MIAPEWSVTHITGEIMTRAQAIPANPRAKRLYERLGFEVTAVEDPFIHMRRDTVM